ncbi:MAG: sigma factor-like helix-turn-helix DNA-binding protein [Ruminococcus sp.]
MGTCGQSAGKSPEVLRARYQEDLTLKETAARVGITIEAVRQWQNKGIRELRKPSRSNELKPLYLG